MARTYEGIEVKSGTAGLGPAKGIRRNVSRDNPAYVTITPK